jgi:hypothetical protein
LHSLINEISSLLIQSNFNEISLSINKALNMLGDYANVDRVYIFEFDYLNNTMNNTYEWCAEGVTPEIDNLKNLPNDLFLAGLKNLIITNTCTFMTYRKLRKNT